MNKYLVILIFLISQLSFGQAKAFPGAYGAGASATGGRGLAVYHVTNLNDSGTGSFRQAVSDASSNNGGNIVFDVSGVINLNSVLSFTDNLTISGQTAPEGGITIDGEKIYNEDIDNLIVRHIRFKGGIDSGNSDKDSVTTRGNINNQIWDHCTFAFGGDEAASFYETTTGKTVTNLTVQRCFFPENSKGSIIGGGSGTTTTGDLTFIYNAFYNTSHRFPNTSGNNANIDVFCNLVWGNSSRLIRVNGDGQNLNHVNNYYDFGTNGMTDDRLHMYDYETGYPNIYTSGNFIYAQSPSTPLTSTAAEMNANNKLAWKQFQADGRNTPYGMRYKGDQLEDDYFTNTQHAIVGVPFPILTASEVLAQLPLDVGCNARLSADGTVSDNKDVEDTSYLNNIIAGNYVTKLNSSQYNVTPITSFSRAASYDTDNDGMPDVWEAANALDPNVYNPSGYDLDTDFTNIEMFVNLVDGVYTPPTPDSQAPSKVSGGIASNISQSAITFGWNATSDNVAVTGYRVYIDNVLVSTVTNGTTYNATGLSANTSYDFHVIAIDAAGNTALQSDTVTTTTLSAGVSTQKRIRKAAMQNLLIH